jgi:hypothetical protein
MTTHEFNNQASQSERREILKDTYLTRAAADADLASSGRFKKETTTRVTGVPTYPSLPESSPWASGFDVNAEPPLGFAVDEMPASVPIPQVATPTAEVDRTEEPAVGDVSFVASQAAGSHSNKRRGW